MNHTLTEHRRRAEELGLRQTSTGSCPRRLVGKACRGPDCWCMSRLNDHGRRYRTMRDDSPRVLWEPYDASWEELADVFLAARDDGLRVTVTGASPWNPGRTFVLRFAEEVV